MVAIVLPLESPRLVLRRFRPADVAAFVAYRSDPEVARYQGWETCTVEDAEALVEGQKGREPGAPGEWFQIAFALRESDALIGDCGLQIHESEPRQATVGITIARAHQRQGFGAEALSCLFDHLFIRTEVRRVVADTDPENVAAWTLLERLGMRRERHLRESLRFKGRWADEYLYAILREEWLGTRQTESRGLSSQDDYF